MKTLSAHSSTICGMDGGRRKNAGRYSVAMPPTSGVSGARFLVKTVAGLSKDFMPHYLPTTDANLWIEHVLFITVGIV